MGDNHFLTFLNPKGSLSLSQNDRKFEAYLECSSITNIP